MTKTQIAFGLVTVALLGAILFVLIGKQHTFGAASPSDIQSTNFSQVTANALTVNTSNTATSTTSLGCVQMFATSTATVVHLEFSTTTVNATYTGGIAPTGAVAWRYGACPV